jgi:hypothetical protein
LTIVPSCNVTITNLRTGETLTNTSDPVYGYYIVDATEFMLGWYIGDLLRITATKGTLIGWTSARLTDSPNGYDQIDVKLGVVQATITLTVTDTLGQTAMVSKTVALPMYYA